MRLSILASTLPVMEKSYTPSVVTFKFGQPEKIQRIPQHCIQATHQALVLSWTWGMVAPWKSTWWIKRPWSRRQYTRVGPENLMVEYEALMRWLAWHCTNSLRCYHDGTMDSKCVKSNFIFFIATIDYNIIYTRFVSINSRRNCWPLTWSMTYLWKPDSSRCVQKYKTSRRTVFQVWGD